MTNSEAQPPHRVALLGLGPSVEQYVALAKGLGARRKLADEVWSINALGDVIQCDRIFHMDDVRIQEIRAAANPDSNIAAMLQWLKVHPGPVYTSRVHEAYPGLVEFPLQQVLDGVHPFPYFNSTAAYAVAYAIYLGVKEIFLFGFDFTYANAHHAEKGRACVEFWLGVAVQKGIKVQCAKTSTLLDACEPASTRLYGYDTLRVEVTNEKREDGSVRTNVKLEPREELPTAAEIEERYDHSRHPNELVHRSTTR